MPPLHQKNLRTAAGWIAALGLFGNVAPCAASPQSPPLDLPAATQASDAAPAPAATTTPKPAADGPLTVLVRTDGSVARGEIIRDATGYILKHRIGVIHYARRDVEAVFRSMDELYAYKLQRCPPNDSDERMKLANWCIEQNMKPQAKVQLLAFLELSPNNPRAMGMLANLDRAENAIAMKPPKDPQVGKTEFRPPPGVQAEGAALDRLREEYQRNPRAAGIPVIFDLETPLAVRRYQEYINNIHPLLQRRCARCHNEATPGEFQLLQTRTKRDLSNDLIVRSNMEATLQIINRDDLARSPILTASGMTHGNAGKPVLGGPSTPEYRALAAWVTSLKPAPVKAPNLTTPPSGAGSTSEDFAAGRSNPHGDPAMPPAAPARRRPQIQVEGDMVIPPASIPGVVGAMPAPDPAADVIDASQARKAGSLIPGSDSGIPNNPPPDDQFRSAPIRKPRASPAPPQTAAPKADPSAPKTIRLPDGTEAPLMTREDVARKKVDPNRKIDPKALQNFLKGAPVTPAKPRTP